MRSESPESCWIRVGRSWVLPLDGTDDWSAAGNGPILAVRGTGAQWTAAAKMAEAWIDLPGEWPSREEAQTAVLRFARRFVKGVRRQRVETELQIAGSAAERRQRPV